MLLLFATSALAAFGYERAAVRNSQHAGGASSAAVLKQLRTLTTRSDSRLARMVAAEPMPEVLSAATVSERMEAYVKSRGGNQVIRKILVANNGMAATKTIMSIRNWAYNTFGDERAIQFVAMATPDDLAANAEFIRRADEFVEVPGGSNANNYANVNLIVDLCVSQNVDAVMVGWGHASENPKLGDLLKERSAQLGKTITFVGPTSPVMRVLGDKIGANLMAQTAGVSTMPWNGDGMTATLDKDGNVPQKDFDKACIFSEQEAVDAAERIGYPVMLKASEGGGGKGIRMAKDEAALRAAWPQVLAEVPGSPIFLVQLCTGARHLEVQVVADKHGNAIALGGRDCSTQRRFQKIFEEGPPTIAPDDTFCEMMRAAVRLCNTLGYQSAGTVEYLFIPETNDYYFLELNPRLQVEHPVTEGITGVSLPATQIQVAMGLPLYNIPEIRRFYGHDYAGIGEINLDYFKPSSKYDKHVIAARITAENPDEGFKPTSGKIDRINFQSNTKVWGYFSVIGDGGVHEFADSQFGHVFASGETREEARRNLVMALKELFIMGDIRTTVEYLGELLETDEFKRNDIDTAWLDGILASKSVSVVVDPQSAVINAAVYRAYKNVQSQISEFKTNLEKGQLSTLPLRDLEKVPIEITYQDVKYSFIVTPTAPDRFLLKQGNQLIEVKTRAQADGSLYVAYGTENHQLYAKEEPLGLRMVLDGVTVLLPTVYDPSEMRSDITGKLVRYLVEDGAEIKAGQPFAEAEAMKMIITVKASETGKISHALNPGAIINAGDMLATLALKDPSKVKKITPFDGELKYASSSAKEESTLQAYRSARQNLELVLDGYPIEAEPMIQTLLQALSSYKVLIEEVRDAAAALGNKLPAELDEKLKETYANAFAQHVEGEDSPEVASLVVKLKGVIDAYINGQYESKQADLRKVVDPINAVLDRYAVGLREHALAVVCSLFSRFMAVERSFMDAPSTDLAIAALMKANNNDLDAVFKVALSHLQLPRRKALVISLLRQLPGFPERFGVAPLRKLPPALDVVLEMSRLPGDKYKDVALTAARFGLMKAEKPFEEQVAEVKQELLDNGADAAACKRALVTNALLALFSDPEVDTIAMQGAMKRMYRTYNIKEMSSSSMGAIKLTEFKYQAADKALGDAEVPERYGMLAVVSDLAALEQELTALLDAYKGSGPSPLNVLHLALAHGIADGLGAEEELISTANRLLMAQASTLRAKGIRLASLMVPNPPKWPRQFAFPMSTDYAEEPARRNMYPTMYNLLDIERLSLWNLKRMRSISHNSVVLLGQQGTSPRIQQRLFVRGITHSESFATEAAAESALQKAMDELQLAKLDTRVLPTASSHLFLHILAPFDNTPTEIIDMYKETMANLIAKYATRLLKLSVDEIEVRAHSGLDVASRQAVRLVASSMSGQWLKTDGYIEFLDPVTGATQSYCSVGKDDICYVEPYPVSSTLANKRAVARRIGTTYCYDFLGLIDKALVREWQQAIVAGKFTEMPKELFEVEELLLTSDGKLEKGSRVVGENKVGMVGWETTLKTPEYPEGRPLIIVANDCTVQSGSFGIQEDEFFDKISKYARSKRVPRLHIASNSGARIGLAEELKPFFKVAWNDPSNEAMGYKYLYLSEEDVARFPEGVFHGEYVTEGGEKRFRLDDIVGQQDGIGVENLRGSGLIAGETSAAYEETFTLSYVTGRSVGIGAYINRLAQRVIQMANGPIILTGFSALNKLLGREVYVSQDQLGGPQIMLPNGVSHLLASDDQDGVEKILRWLSYVPKTARDQVPITKSVDPVDRDITFKVPPNAYDPRHMLAGVTTPDGSFESGFFDQGSFTEYQADWGKSVVVGRAKLGGIPMGVISVETRLVEQRIPADPANPNSREAVLAQAGQVWYPDSAYKTAQAIADFNAAENLPLIVFANWRGFSGGTRDMYGEVLKFGAYIVDNLRAYKQPVFVYIPPNGELRGGAWVVVDPTINADMMEMYADTNARGGILEPPGICDVKFRRPDLVKTMHRLDSKLQQLEAERAVAEESLAEEEADALRKQIESRVNALLPLYTQISYEFADLHDRPGRMLAKGVIRDVVSWKRSREYFYWRLRRRLAQDRLVKDLKESDSDLTHANAVATIRGWLGDVDWEDDKAVLDFLEAKGDVIAAKLDESRVNAAKKSIAAIMNGLAPEFRAELLDSL
ncbi:hypothetical protein AB1Y20_014521 [Prymnesium parvum]|uniref:Acetyl-CoA carboxylase n=1 Tax=Prymnesium parvum TaxID=97485 RepID=A0AB34IBJ9_PRYPA